MRFLRLRNVVTIGGSLVCLLYLVATQPEVGWIRQLPVGGTTAQWLGDVSRFFIGLAAIFLGRKALTDYRAADMEEQHKVANTSPVGAGLALVSQGLTYIALALLAMPLVSKAESYPKAAPVSSRSGALIWSCCAPSWPASGPITRCRNTWAGCWSTSRASR